MSLCKLQKSLEISNFGTDNATQDGPRGCGNAGGGLIGEECRWSARWHLSLTSRAILDPCDRIQAPKRLEMGNFGTNSAAKGVPGGMHGEG